MTDARFRRVGARYRSLDPPYISEPSPLPPRLGIYRHCPLPVKFGFSHHPAGPTYAPLQSRDHRAQVAETLGRAPDVPHARVADGGEAVRARHVSVSQRLG